MSNEKTIKSVQEKIDKAYEKLTRASSTKVFATFVRDDVKKRVRMGYGVKGNLMPKENLKPLKQSTIDDRKKLQGEGKLNAFTNPRRSNLTRSGQLTDSLVALGMNKEFIIEVQDARNDGKTNSQIVSGQEKQGRPFLYITDLEQKRLNNLVKKAILSEIRKNFK